MWKNLYFESYKIDLKDESKFKLDVRIAGQDEKDVGCSNYEVVRPTRKKLEKKK